MDQDGSSTKINLFRSKNEFSPIAQLSEQSIRIIAYVLVGILIIGGLTVAGFSMYLSARQSTLETQRAQISKSISDQILKEGMILDMKARLVVVGNIIKSQKTALPFIDTMAAVIGSADLTSLTIGDANTVTLTVKLPSFEETFPFVEKIRNLVKTNKINFPRLESLNINERGMVQISVSYKVVL